MEYFRAHGYGFDFVNPNERSQHIPLELDISGEPIIVTENEAGVGIDFTEYSPSPGELIASLYALTTNEAPKPDFIPSPEQFARAVRRLLNPSTIVHKGMPEPVQRILREVRGQRGFVFELNSLLAWMTSPEQEEHVREFRFDTKRAGAKERIAQERHAIGNKEQLGFLPVKKLEEIFDDYDPLGDGTTFEQWVRAYIVKRPELLRARNTVYTNEDRLWERFQTSRNKPAIIRAMLREQDFPAERLKEVLIEELYAKVYCTLAEAPQWWRDWYDRRGYGFEAHVIKDSKIGRHLQNYPNAVLELERENGRDFKDAVPFPGTLYSSVIARSVVHRRRLHPVMNPKMPYSESDNDTLHSKMVGFVAIALVRRQDQTDMSREYVEMLSDASSEVQLIGLMMLLKETLLEDELQEMLRTSARDGYYEQQKNTAIESFEQGIITENELMVQLRQLRQNKESDQIDDSLKDVYKVIDDIKSVEAFVDHCSPIERAAQKAALGLLFVAHYSYNHLPEDLVLKARQLRELL